MIITWKRYKECTASVQGNQNIFSQASTLSCSQIGQHIGLRTHCQFTKLLHKALLLIIYNSAGVLMLCERNQTIKKFNRCWECFMACCTTTASITYLYWCPHTLQKSWIPALFIYFSLATLFGAIKWWCTPVLLSHTLSSQGKLRQQTWEQTEPLAGLHSFPWIW